MMQAIRIVWNHAGVAFVRLVVCIHVLCMLSGCTPNETTLPVGGRIYQPDLAGAFECIVEESYDLLTGGFAGSTGA